MAYLEIDGFQTIVGGLIEMVDSLAKEVEREKMKVSKLTSFSSQLPPYVHDSWPCGIDKVFHCHTPHVYRLNTPTYVALENTRNCFCNAS